MEHNRKEEIDLFIAIDKARDSYRSFLISIIDTFKSVLKVWYLFIAIILVGLLLGYYQESNRKVVYKSELFVQMNFNSTKSIYNAIMQLDLKLKRKGAKFLEELEIENDNILMLGSAKVEPMVNVLEVMENEHGNDRNVEVLLKEASEEDQILKEMFLDEYKTHKITLKGSSNASRETIDAFMEYLNSNELYSELQEIEISNTKLKIQEYRKNLILVDSVLGAYGKSPVNEGATNRIYLNTGNLTNPQLLLTEKETMLKRIATAEKELAKYDSVVKLLNRPVFYEDAPSILSRTKIIYPILFAFLFIFFIWLLRYYRKLEVIAKEKL
jgi:hypothetical protein